MTRIFDMTATELGICFGDGSLSPVEVTKSLVSRIRELDPGFGAFCLIDEDTTLRLARASEERWRRGMALGPLDGVPIAIKDVLATRGWPTRKGSHLCSPDPELTDAPAVAALLRNGLVPIGKTTTPELGWKGVTDSALCGVTRNPWDASKTAGGSSGGSGAAVALGFAPLAIGTDGGGSIRIPASFCGVFGLKPTWGRVPMWPPSCFGQLAHVGPMTWSVRDAALLMNVLSEGDLRDSTLPDAELDFAQALSRSVRGLRIAYAKTLGGAAVDAEVEALSTEAACVLEQLGARVEEVDPGFALPTEAFETRWNAGTAFALRGALSERRDDIEPGLVECAEAGARLSALDLLAAKAAREQLTEHMGAFHQRYDLLLTPTLPITAFAAGREVPEGWPHRRWHTWTPFTYPFNMTGQPAASVPCGFTASGLPVGLQIVGARHADATVLAAAHAYQCANPLTNVRPSPGDASQRKA